MLKIPVFLASDDNYAPFVATTMTSILMNTKEFIKFYILDCGISNKNKKKIINEKKFFSNFSIEFIEIDISEQFKDFPKLKDISKAMYARYLIAELKPEIDRAIYSDIDVTFVSDVKQLWQEDLGTYMLGAVPSQRGKLNSNYAKEKRKFNLHKDHAFFMSGLLLIDCKKWRSQNISTKLLHTTFEKQSILSLPDQEVFNIIFNNNYKILDKKYCVIYKLFNSIYNKTDITYLNDQQVIVHYPGSGEYKPWNNKKLPSSKYFWDTVIYTCFSKEINKIHKNFRKKENKMAIKNILQTIFSVKNSPNKKHKIISILGVKIKISTKKKSAYITQETLSNEINGLKNEIFALRTLMNICVDITKVPKTKGKLRELQLADTLFLQIFHKICKKHNIDYWLDYGTLLGAIRHKGFIPWDDDIDIAMMRNNYNKIKDIINEELGQFGFIVNEGKNFSRQIIRIIFKETPIQIDIWPYECIDKKMNNNEEKEELIKRIKLCHHTFFEQYSIEDLQTGKTEFPKKAFDLLQKHIIFDDTEQKTPLTIFGGSEAIVYKNPNIFDYEDVYPLQEIQFENTSFYAPNKADIYLSKIYKDYMELPKENILRHEVIQSSLIFDIKKHIETLQTILNQIN